MSGNYLYYGDNLDILRRYIKDQSVDLVYLDPPFNSKATYNVLFQEKNGTHSRAQITAFDDTWHWGLESESAYHELVTQGPNKLADLMQALRSFLGQNDMMAYLVMMAQRLLELRRVLKPTGSIYLHCDPTASHYLKLVMDVVFGIRRFRSEIIWRRTNAKGLAFKGYPSNHDVIFYYSVSDDIIWNRLFKEYDPNYIEKFYRYIEPTTGRRYQLSDLTNPNRDRPNLTYEWNGHTRVWRWTKKRMEEADKKGLIHYTSSGLARQKRYLDEMKGIPIDTIWDDVGNIQAQSSERLGYPTQKPEALLERIIKASSNEGHLVLDPFCGCGTAIAVAERLHRKWIGIDITHLAISLMKSRLATAFGTELSSYEVIGDPKDLESAKALAEANKTEFERWAVGLIKAMPYKLTGADGGIDGYLRFIDDKSGVAKKIIVQVKGGHVTRSQVATLKGDMQREKAVIGAFITLNPPTKPMREEAATAGFYEPENFPGKRYPRVQILTIEELLGGKQLEYPRLAIDATFKKAPTTTKGPTYHKLIE